MAAFKETGAVNLIYKKVNLIHKKETRTMNLIYKKETGAANLIYKKVNLIHKRRITIRRENKYDIRYKSKINLILIR
jgi:hypothetical protein